ncbi:hypothetical protein PWP93_25660 [Paraburkholderia sp. A1RI-2L]|uniref:hypothetical protein n=1 Tax=Paraburkholderia sp. A1RI-2L TaxID=3028367 RepID=UPI003B770723
MKKRPNAVLALLSYTVTPDQTASSLGINNGNTCNPALNMTPLGGPVPDQPAHRREQEQPECVGRFARDCAQFLISALQR